MSRRMIYGCNGHVFHMHVFLCGYGYVEFMQVCIHYVYNIYIYIYVCVCSISDIHACLHIVLYLAPAH